jgi:hypothetical protein
MVMKLRGDKNGFRWPPDGDGKWNGHRQPRPPWAQNSHEK